MRKNKDLSYNGFSVVAEEETKLLLEKLKNNQKQYSKIYRALSLLGKFSGKVTAELFEDNAEKVDLVITDDNSDLFIFTVSSTSKNDLNIIRRVSSSEEAFYDLSLVKKSEITEENIEICRTFKTYDTRYGRFVTDYHTFFTLFLGKNICYQMRADFEDNIDCDSILKHINSYEDIPSFRDFIKVFETVLPADYFSNIKEISCYDNFCQLERIVMSPAVSDDKIYLMK